MHRTNRGFDALDTELGCPGVVGRERSAVVDLGVVGEQRAPSEVARERRLEVDQVTRAEEGCGHAEATLEIDHAPKVIEVTWGLGRDQGPTDLEEHVGVAVALQRCGKSFPRGARVLLEPYEQVLAEVGLGGRGEHARCDGRRRRSRGIGDHLDPSATARKLDGDRHAGDPGADHHHSIHRVGV